MRDDPNAHVEISVRGAEISVRGSEEFVKEEIDTVADLADDLADLSATERDKESAESSSTDQHVQKDSETDGDSDDSTAKPPSREPLSNVGEEIQEAADGLNVDPVALGDYFYIDEAGTHVDDPLETDPKYALLGYGLIEKERTGDPYLDNQETKQTLIEQEMLPIESWGGTFLYGLRQDGLIQNDPRSEKKRNVPFRITPEGRREFVEWLSDED